MRKLLIIAYTFPPAAGVGIYRPVKFAKYLPGSGWDPVVLTVKNGKYAKYDERLLGIVPDGIAVHRAGSFEWLNEGQNSRSVGRTHKRTLLSRIYKRMCIVWDYFMIPDNKVTWVPLATIKGLRVIRRDGIRHVFVTGKPFSSFITGCLLQKLTGARLVIDYRDPWTQNINYQRKSPLHTWIDKRLERWVIRRSDVVVANTRVNEEMLVEEFGRGEPRDKFVTIHNGFDSEDYESVPAGKYDKFTITYAGAFYFSVGSDFTRSAGDDVMRTYSPLYFFEALQAFLTRRPEVREKIQVNFMGVLGYGYDTHIKDMGLDGIVRRLGFLDYDEHIAVLKRSHALLLVLSRGDKSRGWVPSKLFSYLGSGNPVLALVPEGEVRAIIERTRGGLCVEPDDSAGAADAIEKLYDAYAGKGTLPERDDEEVMRFDRKHLTALLARTLEPRRD